VFVVDGRVIYSASDLAAAARCEYALLRSFDARLGWGPAVSSDDELLARTAQLGDEHEQRHLDELRARAHDENVVVIGRPAYTLAGLTAAATATREAVDRRAPVVYQAAMFDGRFLGFADFLILDGDRYRLRDTKLARSVKVEALLQLAAYADTLATAGVPVAPDVELMLGDGTHWSGCSTATWQGASPCHGKTPRSARASAVRSAPCKCGHTTTCCSSPACVSASGPASSTQA
jgi:predicted RecB family nuclease